MAAHANPRKHDNPLADDLANMAVRACYGILSDEDRATLVSTAQAIQNLTGRIQGASQTGFDAHDNIIDSAIAFFHWAQGGYETP